MTVKAEVFKESQRLFVRGATTEEILCYYRGCGMTILESMQMLRHLMDISLSEAKEIVHCSDTWADLRARHEDFHQALEDVAKSDPYKE